MRQSLRGAGTVLVATFMLSGCGHYNPLDWNMKADARGAKALDTTNIQQIVKDASKQGIPLPQQESFDQSLLRISIVQAEISNDLQAYSDGAQRESLISLVGGLTAAAALLFGGNSDLIAGTGLATFGLTRGNSILSNDEKFAAASVAQTKLTCVLGAWPERGRGAKSSEAGNLGKEWDGLIRDQGRLAVGATDKYTTIRNQHPSVDAVFIALSDSSKKKFLQKTIASAFAEKEMKVLIGRANAAMNTRRADARNAARKIMNELAKAYKNAQPDFSTAFEDAFEAANKMKKTAEEVTKAANTADGEEGRLIKDGNKESHSPSIDENDVANAFAYVAVVRDYAANIADYKSRLTHCTTLGVVTPLES